MSSSRRASLGRGSLLPETPDERRQLAADPGLVPGAVEDRLRPA